MRKLTIFVDMDDVLENLLDHWVDELNTQFGTAVKTEDIKSWNIEQYFAPHTQEEVRRALLTPGFWDDLEAKPDAQILLKQMIEDGHIVKVCTATHYLNEEPKMRLLLRLYPYLSWRDVIITSDKSFVAGDVMIDDGIHNLETFDGHRILFHMPHNANFEEGRISAIRVHNWKELYETICKLAEE